MKKNEKPWYVDCFSACAGLETRLIPDLRDAGKAVLQQAEFPLSVRPGDLDTVRKRFGCPADTLLTAAFGVTVSAWNAETRAFFPTAILRIPSTMNASESRMS